jgi:deoxyribodipyrimidine photo-lyase
MQFKTVLLWFRNDLRLHDNEALAKSLEDAETIIPVYIFDERQFGKTSFGFPKTGAFRTKFLLESVGDLRKSFQRIGSDLVIRRGKPELILPELAKSLGASAVYWHEEVTDEEVRVEREVKEKLRRQQVQWKIFWGATLYHKNDNPFSSERLPDVFTEFRKAVEKNSRIRESFPTPFKLRPIPETLTERGSLPTLADLGLSEPKLDSRAVLNFTGGESAGLKRLAHYLWQSDSLKVYKETRNGLLGADYSSKFSAWLANGSLSPRKIYEEVKRYETERVANDSTYWLVFELIWRDFFRFVALKYGSRIFFKTGINGAKLSLAVHRPTFDAWTRGETGFPFVDANMRELAATGFMSNRGRQNVASFLVKDLKQDWRLGAEWFESLLVDYDVASNYGNWNYVAGIGNDPRENRYFNVIKQASMYDAKGEYVRTWIPELAKIPAPLIHEPFKMTGMDETLYSVTLGETYPKPVVHAPARND